MEREKLNNHNGDNDNKDMGIPGIEDMKNTKEILDTTVKEIIDIKVKSENNVENNVENIVENNVENIAENKAENIAGNIAGNIAENTTENITENIAENMAENIAGNIAENSTENSTENITENVTEKIVENITEKKTENNKKNVADNIAVNVADSISEIVPGNTIKSTVFSEISADRYHNDFISDDKLKAQAGEAQPIKSTKLKAFVKKVTKVGIGSAPSTAGTVFGNLLFPLLFFIGTAMYLEVIFHFLIYRSIDSKIIYPILFAVPFGAILAFISGLFCGKANKVILWLITVVVCIIFQVQLVYFYVFKVYFSFQVMGMAGDAITEFGTDIITAIKANIGGLIIILMPLVILGFLLNSRIDYRRRGMKGQGILLGGSVVFHIAALLALLLFGKVDYSPYDLYFNSKIQDLCGKQLGITTMTRIDISKIIFGQDELVLADTMGKELIIGPALVPTLVPTPVVTKIPEPTKPVEPDATPTPTPLPTPTPIDTSPNSMDIDFSALASQEKNKTIKTLHNYFGTITPTNKNEYTGMFEGYNLIMITAEGFSPYAINEAKTPTLYKMVREGFVFNNFYTPLWQTSTSDGEYVAMTGLIPIGTRSMYKGRNNLWPFSLGRQFNLLGVESKAYHNHTYTYYQRNETHPNLGYLWKAKGNGLELPSDCWPGSDLEMINATVEEYIEEEQFHVYYLTVSGHMNYTFTGNSMASKNKSLVQDLPYSSDAKAYIACQMELDMALEQLIAKLEEAGVADRTVIALSADHYPYGWEKYKLDELAGHEIEPNFEIYKNHFILWNPGMEESIVIDEPCSSLDILPTLSNLFGLEYDSRLLMGQDILSDADPLVILSNRSFITDKVMYNSTNGETTLLTEETLPENYISNLNKIIKNKFSVSKSILDENYYQYIFPE